MRCYLITVCAGSSLDRDANNMSLFTLVEEVQVSPFQPEQLLPLQGHMYLEALPEEIGREIDTRLVWRRSDGTEYTSGATPRLPVTNGRIRIRSAFIKGPREVGRYSLHFEWRWAGDEAWRREPCAWPLDITEVEAPAGVPQ